MQSNDNTGKRTPGPWKVIRDGGPFHAYGIWFDTICIGRVSTGTVENEFTQKANAQLIAASPRMLQALKDMVCWALSENDPADLENNATYQEAVKAIAEAEGRANV